MKLIAYPESKLEPRKIVVEDEVGEMFAQVYIDGTISVHGRLISDREFSTIRVVRENFILFYENIENINLNK